MFSSRFGKGEGDDRVGESDHGVNAQWGQSGGNEGHKG